jgi:hypothetical protein
MGGGRYTPAAIRCPCPTFVWFRLVPFGSVWFRLVSLVPFGVCLIGSSGLVPSGLFDLVGLIWLVWFCLNCLFDSFCLVPFGLFDLVWFVSLGCDQMDRSLQWGFVESSPRG